MTVINLRVNVNEEMNEFIHKVERSPDKNTINFKIDRVWQKKNNTKHFVIKTNHIQMHSLDSKKCSLSARYHLSVKCHGCGEFVNVIGLTRHMTVYRTVLEVSWRRGPSQDTRFWKVSEHMSTNLLAILTFKERTSGSGSSRVPRKSRTTSEVRCGSFGTSYENQSMDTTVKPRPVG